MNDFRKLLIVPAALGWMPTAGCDKKAVALRPPPQPQPTVTASRIPEPPPAPTMQTRPPGPATTATPPKSGYPDQATRDRIDTLLARISDGYFDYDQHTLRPDAVTTLQADSIELRDILTIRYKLVIEGYADERGSDEYNLGLGNARAESAKEYLVQVGIPAQQMPVISYGKERQICTEHNETCWQKNRRIHIVAQSKQPA
jgi:outer membrane protein OmpA-like peptidoglycan-associated protein